MIIYSPFENDDRGGSPFFKLICFVLCVMHCCVNEMFNKMGQLISDEEMVRLLKQYILVPNSDSISQTELYSKYAGMSFIACYFVARQSKLMFDNKYFWQVLLTLQSDISMLQDVGNSWNTQEIVNFYSDISFFCFKIYFWKCLKEVIYQAKYIYKKKWQKLSKLTQNKTLKAKNFFTSKSLNVWSDWRSIQSS